MTHSGDPAPNEGEEVMSAAWCNKQGGEEDCSSSRLLSSSLGRQTQPPDKEC